MTAAVEKKPDEVPPSSADAEEEVDDVEEDGAPEAQGAGGKRSIPSCSQRS